MQRRTRRQVLAGLGATIAGGLAGCSEDGLQFTETPTATQAALDADARYGYTHGQPSGNRVLAGAGALADSDPVAIDTDLSAMWLVALPAETGSYWTAVSTLGQVTTYHVVDGTVESTTEQQGLLAGVPPLVRRTADGVGLVRPPNRAAPRTHPVVTDAGLLSVAENGDLVLDGADGTERWAVDALPDGRIVRVEGGRYALLGDVTTRYEHAALGDDREGGSLVVFDAAVPEVTVRTEIGPPAVIEGISPLVADLDGDGTAEIVVTLADSSDGARIALFDQAGTELARGPIHGSGWRHQLAVADYGAGPELAVTRQPHVDYTVEFYRFDGDSLSIAAEYPNVSTHSYGSYNTDMAIAGDFDDDGTTELLVPVTDRTSLLAVERSGGAARTDWQWYVDRGITSNLAGTMLADGGVAVGVGTEDGLRVWQS
jgi:hypothetical protein